MKEITPLNRCVFAPSWSDSFEDIVSFLLSYPEAILNTEMLFDFLNPIISDGKFGVEEFFFLSEIFPDLNFDISEFEFFGDYWIRNFSLKEFLEWLEKNAEFFWIPSYAADRIHNNQEYDLVFSFPKDFFTISTKEMLDRLVARRNKNVKNRKTYALMSHDVQLFCDLFRIRFFLSDTDEIDVTKIDGSRNRNRSFRNVSKNRYCQYLFNIDSVKWKISDFCKNNKSSYSFISSNRESFLQWGILPDWEIDYSMTNFSIARLFSFMPLDYNFLIAIALFNRNIETWYSSISNLCTKMTQPVFYFVFPRNRIRLFPLDHCVFFIDKNIYPLFSNIYRWSNVQMVPIDLQWFDTDYNL